MDEVILQIALDTGQGWTLQTGTRILGTDVVLSRYESELRGVERNIHIPKFGVVKLNNGYVSVNIDLYEFSRLPKQLSVVARDRFRKAIEIELGVANAISNRITNAINLLT